MYSDQFFYTSLDVEDEVNSEFAMFTEACQAAYEASKPKLQRTPVERDRYGAHDRLVMAYFFEHPQYDETTFRKVGISSLMKCTFAIHQMTYGAVPNSLDEYLQMGVTTARDSLRIFCKVIMNLYGKEFLRKPTYTDMEKLYVYHDEKHVFLGMLENIDCTDWPWANCPLAYIAQFCRGDHEPNPFILLEGRAPDVPFVANNVPYKRGYYLTDGIYPQWSVLIKSIKNPGRSDHKRILYKTKHEAARKDVERAFDVLKQKWKLIKYPARGMSRKEQHRDDDPYSNLTQAQLNPLCNSNDSVVLKSFMNVMDSAIDGWTTNSSNCCDWDGVTCNLDGKVVKLELSKKRLVGTLVESLSSLDQLKTLNISRNLFKGKVPSLLFHLKYLEVLDLSSNEFSEGFPDSVDLPRIEVLMHLLLDANLVSGIIPEYLFRLPRLVKLLLQDNMIVGQLQNSIPSNLVYLDVSLNLISGDLPDFFHTFPNLSYFAAHSNNIGGRIPVSLLNSGSISSLILRNNSFSGLIRLNCSAMVNLELLDLTDNKFIGTIPDNLPTCQSLKVIDLGGNNLTGQIPESFKLFDSLAYLSLSMCNLKNLSGSLEILQHCSNLTTLVLSRSFDNEEMPYDSNLQFKMLKTFVIPSCKLTGMIPVWLNGLTKLRMLDLSWNQLSGHIPPFVGNLPSLIYLDLSNNFLKGEIPKSLTEIPDLLYRNISLEVSLEYAIFMKRSTNGTVLRYSYGVRFPPTLDLSNNFLTGPIWPEFGNLINLHVLNLKYNELSGNIPSSFENLTCIENMDLSHNDLSGEIPVSLVKLGMLSKFSVAYNNLTGLIPSGGQFSTFSASSFEGNPGLCGEFVLSCEKGHQSLKARVSEIEEDLIESFPILTGFGIGFIFTVILFLVVPRIRDTEKLDKFE
ncbi:phytosulfokine receptor 1-like protein [Tanacetum coccineum]|uniref:Phytosulfokine receptor 1-like protein n=1 Tax=Tanacetum coccineum TaxID=301880 RepID=A0ABQ5JCF6_9ASTR